MATAPLANQARYMAWRAVIRTARQPIVIVPPLVFPLFLLAINASGLDAATQIPGFPADSYLAFVLAFPFMQGAIFATNTAGTNIAQDIGSGFFNRLSLTPMRGLLAARRPADRGPDGRDDPGDCIPRRRPRRRRRTSRPAHWAWSSSSPCRC